MLTLILPTCPEQNVWKVLVLRLESQKLATWLKWYTERYLFLESKECHLRGFCGHVTSRSKPSIFVSQIRYASPVRLCHLVLVVEFHRTMSQTYLSSCEKSSLASVWNSLNSYLRWNISMNPRDVFSVFAFGAFCLAKLTAKPLLHPFLPYWRENTAHVRWLVSA